MTLINHCLVMWVLMQILLICCFSRNNYRINQTKICFISWWPTRPKGYQSKVSKDMVCEDALGVDYFQWCWVLMNFLKLCGRISKEHITNKLVSFGADGVSVLQEMWNGIIMQIQQDYTPFVVGMHCMAHQCNLVM